MNTIPYTISSHQIGPHYVQICQPPPGMVKATYEKQKAEQPELLPPYWARLWPSSLVLANYLMDHSNLIRNKTVVELAAGLGLPSLLASFYAKSVIVSDYIQDSKIYQELSIEKNELKNIEAEILDWRELPATLSADIFLLSDTNYDPRNQEQLLQVITELLNRGANVLLATPQRLLSRNFVSKLQQRASSTEDISIEIETETVVISILLIEVA